MNQFKYLNKLNDTNQKKLNIFNSQNKSQNEFTQDIFSRKYFIQALPNKNNIKKVIKKTNINKCLQEPKKQDKIEMKGIKIKHSKNKNDSGCFEMLDSTDNICSIKGKCLIINKIFPHNLIGKVDQNNVNSIFQDNSTKPGFIDKNAEY